MQEARLAIPEKWLTEAMNSRIPERFGDVYDYFTPQIYRHALFRLGDRAGAEDIAGETFLRAWEYLASSSTPIVNARAFLLRIAHNLITDRYRKRQREDIPIEEIPERQLPSVRPSVLRSLESASVRREVREALQKLDGDYRDLVVWRYIDELSVEEIVEISGKSANAIYVSLHRGLRKLRIVLEEKGVQL